MIKFAEANRLRDVNAAPKSIETPENYPGIFIALLSLTILIIVVRCDTMRSCKFDLFQFT